MNEQQPLYNRIGQGYNTTRQADPYLTDRLFELLAPKADGIYLDIGCGTGNYTIALAKKGLQFYGVEPSEKMLDAALEKSAAVNWLYGSAENIPAENTFFDGAIATLTVHHWTNQDKAFSELYRVLKPETQLVIFTATPVQMHGYWLNHYFPDMMKRSIAQMPTAGTVIEAANKAGFMLTATEKYFIAEDLKDLFLYSGKHHPQLYFDQQVRNGISSFTALANTDEVIDGLSKLNNDLEYKRFKKIKAKYHNEGGDYLFIILTK